MAATVAVALVVAVEVVTAGVVVAGAEEAGAEQQQQKDWLVVRVIAVVVIVRVGVDSGAAAALESASEEVPLCWYGICECHQVSSRLLHACSCHLFTRVAALWKVPGQATAPGEGFDSGAVYVGPKK